MQLLRSLPWDPKTSGLLCITAGSVWLQRPSPHLAPWHSDELLQAYDGTRNESFRAAIAPLRPWIASFVDWTRTEAVVAPKVRLCVDVVSPFSYMSYWCGGGELPCFAAQNRYDWTNAGASIRVLAFEPLNRFFNWTFLAVDALTVMASLNLDRDSALYQILVSFHVLGTFLDLG